MAYQKRRVHRNDKSVQRKTGVQVAEKEEQLYLRERSQNPHENILHLQRTIGNQALNRMLVQRNPDDENLNGNLGGGWARGNVDTTKARQFNLGAMTPTFSGITPDKVLDMDRNFGLMKGFKTAKKIPKLGMTIAEGQPNPTEVMTTQEHVEQISGQATALSEALSSGSILAAQTAASVLVGTIMSYIKVPVKLAAAFYGIYKLHDQHKKLSEIKRARDDAEAQAQSGDVDAQSVFEAATYGFKKVVRRFGESVVKAIIKLAKAITGLVDLVTGGTAIMFTSISKLITTAATGALSGFHAIKAMYKSSKGTKGVHRSENAQSLIEAAAKAQPQALRLLFKLKVGEDLYLDKMGRKELSDERDYHRFLQSLDAKEWDKLRDDLKDKLSSSTYKSLSQKLKSAQKSAGKAKGFFKK